MTYEIQASVREAQVKSPLQLLWITKLYSTHWQKNLSILR